MPKGHQQEKVWGDSARPLAMPTALLQSVRQVWRILVHACQPARAFKVVFTNILTPARLARDRLCRHRLRPFSFAESHGKSWGDWKNHGALRVLRLRPFHPSSRGSHLSRSGSARGHRQQQWTCRIPNAQSTRLKNSPLLSFKIKVSSTNGQRPFRGRVKPCRAARNSGIFPWIAPFCALQTAAAREWIRRDIGIGRSLRLLAAMPISNQIRS